MQEQESKTINYERMGKVLLYVISDITFLLFSLAIGTVLWYEGSIPGSTSTGLFAGVWEWFKYIVVFAPVVCVATYTVFHMYNNLWKYASVDEVVKIFAATTIIFVLIYGYHVFFLSGKNVMALPRRILVVAWAFDAIMVTFSRFGYRMVKRLFITIGHAISSKSGCRRVMVVGAGYAGYGVVRGMFTSAIRDKLPIIIVDPDVSKNNSTLLGVRVLGGIGGIAEWVLQYEIDEIVIALPSAENNELMDVVEACTKTDCALKILPPLSDVSDNKEQNAIRDVNITDLLARDEIILDNKNISGYLNDKVILVTGGGGSIGSELCRQIAKFAPAQIVIFDIYENDAYNLLNELRAKYKDTLNVTVRIGSVREEDRMEEIFEEFHPHVVFHTAAHKHVSLMEENPAEAVKNNIFGTYNVANCASRYAAERFVLISTDKAVNPVCVYGATKRVTELIVQDMAGKSSTEFMVVRFGNVLGSNGSIIPLFKQQIAQGGPVTITHPDMVRFFMTITEASQLVLQAVGLGQTGKVYVLDMGTPINMEDLARTLIKLSGLRPDKDIRIEYIGLRPGDKLYEELLMEEEKELMQTTYHKKILVVEPLGIDNTRFGNQLARLKELTTGHTNSGQIEVCLREMLPNYKPWWQN